MMPCAGSGACMHLQSYCLTFLSIKLLLLLRWAFSPDWLPTCAGTVYFLEDLLCGFIIPVSPKCLCFSSGLAEQATSNIHHSHLT